MNTEVQILFDESHQGNQRPAQGYRRNNLSNCTGWRRVDSTESVELSVMQQLISASPLTWFMTASWEHMSRPSHPFCKSGLVIHQKSSSSSCHLKISICFGATEANLCPLKMSGNLSDLRGTCSGFVFFFFFFFFLVSFPSCHKRSHSLSSRQQQKVCEAVSDHNHLTLNKKMLQGYRGDCTTIRNGE